MSKQYNFTKENMARGVRPEHWWNRGLQLSPEKIREIIELVNKLQKLGCGVETDNGGQILVYTGLKQNDNGEIVVCE